MRERRWDLGAVVAYAALAAVTVWALEPEGITGLLVAPLLVLCPGYALARAIEGRRHIDGLELATATLALSFATAALGGLLLNLFDVPLTPRAWSTLLFAVTAAAAAATVAVDRGARIDSPAGRRSIRVRPLPLLAAAVACLLLATAAAVAHRSQGSLDRRTSVAALGISPSDDGKALNISVVNAESAPGQYRVRVEAGGRTSRFSLALKPGEGWSGTRRLPRGAGPVRVELFSAARPGAPVRTAWLRRTRPAQRLSGSRD